MCNKIIEKSIISLDIDNVVINKLKKNNINTIKDLWCLKRKELKKLGLTDLEIKNIIIKLQLHSIDLNQKKYNKN